MTAPLGPTARNLVAAARSGLDPSAEIAARVRARVALAVGGAVSAASAPVAPKLALGKLAAILATSGALVVGGWFAIHRVPAEQAAAISLPAPSVEAVSAARAHVTSITHDEAVAAVAVAPATVPRIKPVIAPVVAAPVAAPPPSPPTLAREVALIDAALASIHANDPTAALATLAIYDRETADHGQMAEDAAAVEIDARCRAHQAVDEQISAFTARWPGSVQRSHLTKNCTR